MKATVVVAGLVLSILLPVRSAAQRRGTNAHSRTPPTARVNHGLGRGYPGVGWGYSGYDDQGYANASVPSVVLVMPPQETRPPAPSPEPPRSVIHEYKQAESGSEPAAAFSIVTKNGATENAVAVWVQDGSVNFITSVGGCSQVPLNSVDREATRQANAEKHLTLSLPQPGPEGIERSKL